MLVAGELALRRVSEIEATASARASTINNFKRTSQVQVSGGHRFLSRPLGVFTGLHLPVAPHRPLYAEHGGFCAEPPSQARPSSFQSSGGVDSLWCVQCRSRFPCRIVTVYHKSALATLYPFFLTAPRTAEGRLLTYFLSFCPCFVVLSIRAEGLFYLSYCVTLYLWTLVEEDVRRRREKARYRTRKNGGEDYESRWNPRGLSLDDVRIALFFLFFVQVGFFGTGK